MLNVALKEWNVVCDALLASEQSLLLRKGGISESIGGFELEHSRFLLFPTFLHQNKAMLKPAWANRVDSNDEEPGTIHLGGWAQVSEIIKVRDRAQVDSLDAEHIWTKPLIDMRFDYKPKNPLYLLIVRAYRLTTPVTIQNTPAYAGCKSWVPLEDPVDVSASTPAIDDATFTECLDHIRDVVK